LGEGRNAIFPIYFERIPPGRKIRKYRKKAKNLNTDITKNLFLTDNLTWFIHKYWVTCRIPIRCTSLFIGRFPINHNM